MTERVARLCEQSLAAKPWLTIEGGRLVTEFCRQAPALSAPMLRAGVLLHVIEHRTIYIGAGELILGERCPSPKSAPTYPEICCHPLEDFETLNTREKISYAVCEDARLAQRDEIMPYWQGRSMRDRMFAAMTPEWKEAYAAGIFTEFMEQRSPGHTVLGDVIYRKGLLQLKAEVEESLARLDFFGDPEAYEKQQELEAMKVAADAVMRFAGRHAELAERMAAAESHAVPKSELEKIAAVCRRVPAHAPRTFWEALQAYWFIHLSVVTEQNTWDSFSPGRLDQHLFPFFERDLASGELTRESARELLECFWVKFNNQPAPPKVGVTAAESGTYTDFCNINTGGLQSDGSSAVNNLTYVVLDVIDEMRLLQPSSNLQLSKKNPDCFWKRGLEIVRKGWGQPSIFNADMVVEELLRQGKSIEHARAGGTSGCVETGAFGREAYILTGYFNLPKVLEITLNNGVDPRTGKKIGVESGNPRTFAAYEDLFTAFRRQLQHFADIKIRGNNVIERFYAKYLPAPLLSLLVEDCIRKGKDYNDGGPRYNSTYIMGVAPGTVTDSLAALKLHVFEKKSLAMGDLLDALAANFEGHEKTRLTLWNKTPKYGNDDDYADEVLAQVFDAFFDVINGRPNTKGGTYRVNYLSATCHVYFGSVTGATPDGRRAGEPHSDGISPVQGADRQGLRRLSNRPPGWIMRAPAARCSTRNSLPSWWRAKAASTTWRTWCAPILSSTAITSSSTW
jgi:formate C-acetyltransferase